MTVIIIFLSLLLIPALYLLLGLHIISLGDYVKSGFQEPFKLLFDISRYKEFPEFVNLIEFLIALMIASFLWAALTNRSDSEHKVLFLSIKERRNSSHLASKHETKKMRQRIEFDENGKNLEDNTFRGRLSTNEKWSLSVSTHK